MQHILIHRKLQIFINLNILIINLCVFNVFCWNLQFFCQIKLIKLCLQLGFIDTMIFSFCIHPWTCNKEIPAENNPLGFLVSFFPVKIKSLLCFVSVCLSLVRWPKKIDSQSKWSQMDFENACQVIVLW